VESLFERDGDAFVATVLTQGPWHDNAMYGGAPAALLTWAIEQVPTLVPMRIARLTFDMHRPVPIERLRVTTDVAREGKRLQIVTATIHDERDVEVARVTALRLRLDDGPEQASDPRRPAIARPPGPGPERRYDGRGRNGFLGAMEVRAGGEDTATSWYRGTKPIVLGEETSPAMRLAWVADFTANSGNYLDQTRWSCINPDLTIHLVREPVGEWLCVATRAWYERDGIGLARAELFDLDGFIGTCATTSLVEEVPAPYMS
jgi:hypothetical protein